MLPSPFDLLLEILHGEGVRIEDLHPELLGDRLKPEFWIADSDDPLNSRTSQNLPAVVGGARLEGTPVLFGWLADTPSYDAMNDSLRRYRNQAAIARSWLEVDAANLQLFLATPLGTAGVAEWQEVSALIEADDRICRKLVWLLPEELLRESAAEFLSRTFLASPWRVAANLGVSRLDSMSNVDLPEGWEVILGDTSLDADGLVQRLTEAASE